MCFASSKKNTVVLLLFKAHPLSWRQWGDVVRHWNLCWAWGQLLSLQNEFLGQETIKWDTMMVIMAFYRNSGGREDKAISRKNPLHLKGVQLNQLDIILHSPDPTAAAWALSSDRARLALVKGSPSSWAYEWPLLLLLWPLCTWDHWAILEVVWEEAKLCPQNGLPCSPSYWGPPLPWVPLGTIFVKWVYSHSVPFPWSPTTFLFSRLLCHESSILIHPHSLTNQSMPLSWINVETYLWPYLLPCKVGNQIYCQRFYTLRGFPSSLLNGAVKPKQSTFNCCQPIMQTHQFITSKFFFLHQLAIGHTPLGIAWSNDGKAAEADACGSELLAHILYFCLL